MNLVCQTKSNITKNKTDIATDWNLTSNIGFGKIKILKECKRKFVFYIKSKYGLLMLAQCFLHQYPVLFFVLFFTTGTILVSEKKVCTKPVFFLKKKINEKYISTC